MRRPAPPSSGHARLRWRGQAARPAGAEAYHARVVALEPRVALARRAGAARLGARRSGRRGRRGSSGWSRSWSPRRASRPRCAWPKRSCARDRWVARPTGSNWPSPACPRPSRSGSGSSSLYREQQGWERLARARRGVGGARAGQGGVGSRGCSRPREPLQRPLCAARAWPSRCSSRRAISRRARSRPFACSSRGPSPARRASTRPAAILQAMIDAFGGRRPKERAPVHYQIARLELAMGNRARALVELDTATRVDPQNPEILRTLAELARDDGQLERAEKSYRALLAVLRRAREAGDDAEHRAQRGAARAERDRRRAGRGRPRARDPRERARGADAERVRAGAARGRAARARRRRDARAGARGAARARWATPPAGGAALAELASVLAERWGGRRGAARRGCARWRSTRARRAAHDAALNLARTVGASNATWLRCARSLVDSRGRGGRRRSRGLAAGRLGGRRRAGPRTTTPGRQACTSARWSSASHARGCCARSTVSTSGWATPTSAGPRAAMRARRRRRGRPRRGERRHLSPRGAPPRVARRRST